MITELGINPDGDTPSLSTVLAEPIDANHVQLRMLHHQMQTSRKLSMPTKDELLWTSARLYTCTRDKGQQVVRSMDFSRISYIFYCVFDYCRLELALLLSLIFDDCVFDYVLRHEN